jgi:hypothetical protein
MIPTPLHPGRISTAILLAAGVLSSGTLTGCASTPPSCTDAPTFLVDNTTATTIPVGTRRPWDDRNGVVVSAQPVPANTGDSSWAIFAPAPGASSYVTFLAPAGSERAPNTWRLWNDPVPIDAGALLPAAWPGNFSHGSQAPVKATGGTYSMGVAYLDRPGLESAKVVKVYITTIQVTPGTGDWTFSDPPTCSTR